MHAFLHIYMPSHMHIHQWGLTVSVIHWHATRKTKRGLIKKRGKIHANNGSLWLLRLAVGQGYLCRSEDLCGKKLERSRIWKTSGWIYMVRWEPENGPLYGLQHLCLFVLRVCLCVSARVVISPAASSPGCLCWSPVARCCERSQSEPQHTLCSSPAFPSDSSATKSKSNLCLSHFQHINETDAVKFQTFEWERLNAVWNIITSLEKQNDIFWIA